MRSDVPSELIARTTSLAAAPEVQVKCLAPQERRARTGRGHDLSTKGLKQTILGWQRKRAV